MDGILHVPHGLRGICSAAELKDGTSTRELPTASVHLQRSLAKPLPHLGMNIMIQRHIEALIPAACRVQPFWLGTVGLGEAHLMGCRGPPANKQPGHVLCGDEHAIVSRLLKLPAHIRTLNPV